MKQRNRNQDRAGTMLYLRNAAIISTCVLMLGCAPITNRHPKIAYSDKSHPQSDTAIISCVGMPDYVCSITTVDELSTWNRFTAGKTLWVRVVPGTHKLGLVVQNGRYVSRASLEVNDTKPGHAYNIALTTSGTNAFGGPVLDATYRDLGKMNSYTIRVGQQALRQKDVTAHF
jgi:hypothetical protein